MMRMTIKYNIGKNMHNWCNNIVELKSDKNRIDVLELFLNENNGRDWFNFFRPFPKHELNWYTWCRENWGCKWNCDAHDWKRIDDETISFYYVSPWSPPIALYEFIDKQTKFDIKASYFEDKLYFVGEFVDGNDDCYEYSDLNSLKDIPEHIIKQWNLYEVVENREENGRDIVRVDM